MLTERPLCRRGTVGVWSAHAGGNPKEGERSAEHAHAADRFAREIVGILARFRGALAAADGQAVRRPGSVVGMPFLDLDAANCSSGTRVVPAPSCRRSLCRRGTKARVAALSWCQRGSNARCAEGVLRAG